MSRWVWLIVLVTYVLLASGRPALTKDSPHLPNNAKYFWCSELYDPYYPLSPINATIPFVPRHFPVPTPVSRVTPTYSLFSLTESTGGLLVRVNSTDCNTSCPTLQMTISLSPQGAAFTNVSIPTNERLTVLFPLSYLPANASTPVYYQLLEETSSHLIASGHVIISRYQERANQVVIDYYSNGLLVNGLPYIPMGYYYYWSDTKRMIGLSQNEIHNAMQTPLPYNNPVPPPSDFLQYMDMVGDLGMRVHFDLHALAQSPNSPQKWQTLEATINSVKDHPALLAYYIADEPDGAGFGMDPRILEEVYAYIKEIDPYHPITIVLNCRGSLPRYVHTGDVIMADPYPIGLSQPVGCAGCAGVPMDVANRVDLIIQEMNNTKPMWAVLQAFGGPAEHWNRLPSWQEERLMSYLSIIHGARGIQYFLEGLPASRALWAECRKVSLEINALTPAILSPEVSPTVTVVSGNADIAAFQQTGTDESSSYITIMLANPSSNQQAVTLSMASSGLTVSPSGQVLFENRTVELSSQGQFSDYVNGYATHVYRFHFTPSSATPSRRATVHKNNILRNPSFESQSNIGVADAMWPNVPSDTTVALIDSVVALDGYYSQRLTNAARNATQASISTYIVAVAPQKSMTLSYWTRAMNEEMQIQVSSSCLDSEYVMAVASVWREYQVPVMLSTPAQCSFKLTAVGQGTLWMDLVQLYPTGS